MQTIIIIPTPQELGFFLSGCQDLGTHSENLKTERLPLVHLPELDLIVAPGGLGKAQFGVQTRYLLDTFEDCGLVICAGAGGALVDYLAVGDTVIGTETVEHDIKGIGNYPMPRFAGSETHIAEFKTMSAGKAEKYKVHFNPIASGDEGIGSDDRKRELHDQTQAIAVGWEGAGGARACKFSDTPFLEIRGISDTANKDAVADFKKNLETIMKNLARFILHWAEMRSA